MSKLTSLFEGFIQSQSKNVDSPYYEPLWQNIPLGTPEEDESKERRRKYHREYYQKNKEKIKEYQRDYWRNRNSHKNHRWDMIWIQKKVYEHLLDQYRKWEEPHRWTEIAKSLGVSENSVYTAVHQLTKKWYLGRWTYGKYLLLKFPDNEEFGGEDIWYRDFVEAHHLLIGRWYIDELADKISSWLIAQNKELYEENQRLKETLKKIKEAWMKHEESVDVYYKQWQDSYSDLDQIIMNR